MMSMVSESYINNLGALTPDNWMVTPEFVAGNELSFWAQGQDQSGYHAEYIGIFVSTDGGNLWSNEVAGWTMTSADKQYSVDLSEYYGQRVKVALRHYNISDMFQLNVDYIEVDIGEETELDVLLGDVNFDGVVNASDAILIMRYALGLIDLSEKQLIAANINTDIAINASDAIVIMRLTLGLI